MNGSQSQSPLTQRTVLGMVGRAVPSMPFQKMAVWSISGQPARPHVSHCARLA